jgi:Flp pilus assembly protein TadG
MDGRRKRQLGVAALELTIALPLLLTLFLAIVELGRAFLQYSTLSHAVRDGARYIAELAENGSTGLVVLTAADMAATRNLVVFGNTAGTGPALLPGLATGAVTVRNAGSNNVAVSATYAYQPIFAPGPPDLIRGGTFFSGVFNLRSEVIMKAL